MILDEPLTAMIPPPDLWGSTGYTANNNKVGLRKCNRNVIFQAYQKNVARGLVIFQTDQKNILGRRGAGGGMEQGLLSQEPRGEPELSHNFVTRPIYGHGP